MAELAAAPCGRNTEPEENAQNVMKAARENELIGMYKYVVQRRNYNRYTVIIKSEFVCRSFVLAVFISCVLSQSAFL